jgi:hypothetical protein
MASHSLEELRGELNRLMLEHIESVNVETFLGSNDEYLQRQEQQNSGSSASAKCPPNFC